MGKMHTVKGAAIVTSLPESTLNRWRSEGKGPKFGKLGRRVFYRDEDLTAWLNAQFGVGTDAA